MQNLDFEMAVKKALRKKEMPMKDLAKILKISNAYCSDILRGNRKAPYIREQICEILEIKQEER